MSVSMQGNWTITVKSKSAAFPQRFVVSGASTGNGNHPGNVNAPPVFVTGDSWNIKVQNNPGNGWVDSGDQIKFPTTTATTYRFDIQSNDAGNDQDYNDLILTCSTPRTPTDFIIYGHASWYGPGCWINPCSKRYAVIDSRAGLIEARTNPEVQKAIQALYPDLPKAERKPIGPMPDPPPMVPLVVPLGDTGLPPKRAQVLTLRSVPVETPKSRAADAGEAEAAGEMSLVTGARQVVVSEPVARKVTYDMVHVSDAIDKMIALCTGGPLPRIVLRFQEYDRTLAELAGGPYTGTGSRDTLGRCATDRHGNYIFRFTREPDDFVHDVLNDVAVGENALVQRMPDVIAQIVDASAPTGISYQSAPYWNVGLLRRIDICVPRDNVQPGAGCQGGLPIQAIGNIRIGGPDSANSGARVGWGNTLNASGRITATNSNAPATRCAAWAGYLHLYACFDQPVTRYTIRWKKPGDADWQFFQEPYHYDSTVTLLQEQVGPFDVSLHVDSQPATTVKAYTNIEDQPNDWVASHIHRKAVINSWLYAPEPGAVIFRIDGYNAAGFPVAHDEVKLYIDNTAPTYDIDDVEMLGSAGGDCALFEPPAANPGAPLTVRFRAHHGSMGSYGVTVRKGNGIYSLPITSTGAPIAGSYAHGSPHNCTVYRGTGNTTAYVVSDLAPASGHWLDPGQPFCTFAVNLECTTRVTDGYHADNSYPASGDAQFLLGIQQP